jgi:hypothetical protein
MGRKRSWRKIIEDESGRIIDATPLPGNDWTKDTWPPRGRGRGESRYSPRRIDASFKALKVMRLRTEGYHWSTIAKICGYADHSGAYYAYWRLMDRLNHERERLGMAIRRHAHYSEDLDSLIDNMIERGYFFEDSGNQDGKQKQ